MDVAVWCYMFGVYERACMLHVPCNKTTAALLLVLPCDAPSCNKTPAKLRLPFCASSCGVAPVLAVTAVSAKGER